MRISESELQNARRQLERILANTRFARNERLARFLRFIVERHLEGKDDAIKESVLAVEVFGRSSDHDPRHDSIVRTEAGRLRGRLSEYYLSDGTRDAVVIEIPKGAYVPVIYQRTADSEIIARPRPSRHGRAWLVFAIACLSISIATVASWLIQHRNPPIPIAVLPLINLSEDPSSDYFADGLTGEIIRNLSIIEGLAVRSQTSSFAFKGKPRNIRDARKQLAVDYILEGSVLRSGQRLRINAQLVRVADDMPIWSGRYDRELTDVFAIQDQISRGIVNGLRLRLGYGRRRYETSVEAYDL